MTTKNITTTTMDITSTTK